MDSFTQPGNLYTELFKTVVTWCLDFAHRVVFQNTKTFSEIGTTCCFLRNLQMYYFHEVIVTLTLRSLTTYIGRTAPLTSKRCILYIYSTNIGTEYFKHGIYSPLLSSSKCSLFHNSNYLVPVLFTFYIQEVLKLKK
jgi:hypothetical protein